MQVAFRSSSNNMFLLKIWMPLVFVVGSVGVFWGDLFTRSFLFALPFLIFALFGSSLAIVRVRDGVVSYRRLFRWTRISKDEIVSAGVAWPPFIGSIRLNRYLFPWGRLYFLLDQSSNPNPFGKGEYPMLRYIRKHLIRGDQG